MNPASSIYSTSYTTWRKSIPRLLEAAGLATLAAGHRRIVIKPNLVEPLSPPITTPVGIIEALVDYLQRKLPQTEIIIGEGCGSREHDTLFCFRVLGYSDLAREKNISLVDLNQATLVTKTLKKCRRWPVIHLPELIFDSFLISVPVLKAHSLAGVTLTMKNMMGLAPPAHYQEGGHWKKAAFHQGIQEAILDLNRYRTPDFTLLDATVGMAEAHLWGPTCDPAPNLIIAGIDPVAVDAFGTGLLKKKWQDIGHIAMADGELGHAGPLTIVPVT